MEKLAKTPALYPTKNGTFHDVRCTSAHEASGFLCVDLEEDEASLVRDLLVTHSYYPNLRSAVCQIGIEGRGEGEPVIAKELRRGQMRYILAVPTNVSIMASMTRRAC